MSPVDDELTGRGEGFPRVSGDEPVSQGTPITPEEFSPRERG